MTTRILVTGGAGFIGSALVRMLVDRDHEVIVIDSGAAAGFDHLVGVPAQVIRTDIRDRETMRTALEGCTAIVHLAAQISVPASIADPLLDLDVNVSASMALLDAARQSSVDRFVFASSNAVVGGHPPPATEELTPLPVSPYGAAKAAIEAYLCAYHRAYGLKTVALRFSNVYGPRSEHGAGVVAAFVRAELDGGPIVIRGSGHQTRDFVHVDDVGAAILTCLEVPASQVGGQVFQIGAGAETSLHELAGLVMDAAGARVAVRHEAASAGDVERNFSDISRARRVLGYEPRVSLSDGIADTVAWFRDRRRPA